MLVLASDGATVAATAGALPAAKVARQSAAAAQRLIVPHIIKSPRYGPFGTTPKYRSSEN
jgi:hypothetical protein